MVTFSLKFLKWQWIFCLLCRFFLPLLSRRLLPDLTRRMSEGETAYPWQRLGSPLFLALRVVFFNCLRSMSCVRWCLCLWIVLSCFLLRFSLIFRLCQSEVFYSMPYIILAVSFIMKWVFLKRAHSTYIASHVV